MIEEFELRPSRWWRKIPKATQAALERYTEDQEASRGTWRDARRCQHEGAKMSDPPYPSDDTWSSSSRSKSYRISS